MTTIFHLPGLLIFLAACSFSGGEKERPGQKSAGEEAAGAETAANEKTPGSKTKDLQAGTFQNPVFNKDFPDPNLVKAPDGYFYAYSTQANHGDGLLVMPILRSRDLVNWEKVGAALEKKPGWKEKGGIWAPDAVFYNGLYRLYYSYSTWGDPDPGIGLAVSEQPEGPFRDLGKVFYSKEIGVENSIDAFFIEEGGTPYLFWGSFHGIYGIELTEDGNKVKGEKFRIAGDAFEGTYLLKKGGYYYFFGSTGTCCEGASSTYRVRVGRAASLKGPYLDRDGKPLLENGGTLLLEGNDAYAGPGHNGDIFTDDAGQDWMLYHAYDKKDPKKGRVMLLDKIIWKDGWPEMTGKQPSLETQQIPEFN